MAKKINLPFLILFLFAFIHLGFSIPPDSLRQVNLLYRHGDRSPMKTFPTDKHQEDSWPQGFGWLSNIGKLQHYHLGKFLRQRYDGFLNTTYDHREDPFDPSDLPPYVGGQGSNELHIRWKFRRIEGILQNILKIQILSSCVERCLMSAYSNLAGLYPPQGNQIWNEELLWQPIPVETRPAVEDNLLNLGKPCPRYDELFAQEMNSHEVKEEEEANKAFYDFIDEKTGVLRENISSVWSVADTLKCEKIHNMSAPDWVNKTIYDKLMRLKDFSFYIQFGTARLSRLKGGPLLKRIFENFQNKITGKEQVKVFVYSGHDMTVCALLSALKVFNRLSPPYAATVLTELHEKPKGQYFVRIFYKNSTANLTDFMQDPVQLTVPGCEADCPFEKLFSLLQDTIPIKWDEECQVSSPTTHPLSHNVFVFLLCTTILLILLMLVMAGFFLLKRGTKKYESILDEDFQ